MSQIYTNLAPAFLLILLGYLTTKTRYFKVEWSDGMTSFVHHIAVPALLFTVISRFSFYELLHPLMVLAFYSGVVLNFFLIITLLVIFFRKDQERASILTFSGGFGNTVLLGIPLAISVFGVEGSLPIYLIIAFHTPLLSLAQALLVGIFKKNNGSESRLQSILKELGRNPIILAVVFGVICNTLDLRLNEQVYLFLDKIAAVASTTALFAIGSSLCRFSLKESFLAVTALSVIKLLVFPALVAFLSLVVFSVPIELAKINIFMAALPTGITAYIMAHYYGKEQAISSGTILVTTFVSAFTIGAILTLFDSLVVVAQI